MSTESRASGEPAPRLCVLAATPQLTVTIEPGVEGGTELHLHAGGQGLWLARMARSLGADVDRKSVV